MRHLLLSVAGVLLAVNVHAQAPGALVALRHFQADPAALLLEATDVAGLVVTDQHTDASTGVTYVYLRQSVGGIEVLGTESNVAVSRAGSVVLANERFMRGLGESVLGKTSGPALSPQAAAEAAARALGLVVEEPVRLTGALGKSDGTVMLSDGGFAQEEIPARLVYQRQGKNGLRLAWNLSILQEDGEHWWSVRVDAQTGTLLSQNDWVTHCQFGHEHPDGPIAVAENIHLGEAVTRGGALAPSGSTRAFEAALGASSARNAAAAGYRVVAPPSEAPNYDALALVTNPASATASPSGWHSDGTTSYTITRGNNAYAYEDRRSANGPGFSPDGGAALAFDFTADEAAQTPTEYRSAAITNTFFWSNYIHDVLYQAGFNEAAGNFQKTNFTGQGLGNDALLAEALDGSGSNNANFGTPADGSAPRMQMFQWSSTGRLLGQFVVTTPAAATYPMTIGYGLEPALNGAGVSGALVLGIDGSTVSGGTGGTVNDGCQALTNAAAISGNIAVLDYVNTTGSACSFSTRMLNAQAAGAIGVLMVSGTTTANPNGLPSYITGYSATTTVPFGMISRDNGALLKTALTSGVVTGTMRADVGNIRTSDFDAGVIAHEYGHGLSNRLTGGASNADCLLSGLDEEQQGEGWSDFVGLMLTMRPGDTRTRARGIGTYVKFQGTTGGGIRPAPYSPDFGVNNYTYASIANPSLSMPHGIGFVWATMLWEMAWDLMDRDGIDATLSDGLDETKGNVKAMRLVIDGLKLQPCNPGFVDGRDAILAADRIRYNGANQELIWKAFARRGLGYSASQGGANLRSDGTEAFDVPPAVTVSASAAASVQNGEFLTYTLTVTNTSATTPANNTVVKAPVPAGSRYVTGSASNGGTLGAGMLSWPAFDLATGATVTRTFQVKAEAAALTQTLFSDDAEAGLGNWTVARTSGTADWTSAAPALPVRVHGGTKAFFGSTGGSNRNLSLTLAAPIAVGAGAELRFWNSYQMELGWDGGVVEISTDGATWTPLATSAFAQNGPRGKVNAGAPLAGQTVFSGIQYESVETVADLSAYAGRSVQVRFRATTDGSTNWIGWSVDDVRILNAAKLQMQPTVQATGSALYAGTSMRTDVLAPPATSPASAGVPATLSQAVPPGTSTRTFTLQNTGTVPLHWFTESVETTTLGKGGSAQAVPAWLSISPETGTVPAGGVQTVTLQFNTAGMANGSYSANVTLHSNDQNAPAQAIPVALTVDTALPIELASLAAVVSGPEVVKVRWTTASETNNAGFYVEMAAGTSSTWREVAFVKGAGTTSETQSYEHEVPGLFPGAYRFRLRQVDTDGTVHYSVEVAAMMRMEEAFALTEGRPNPFATRARFQLAVREAQRVRLSAYDLQGREVATLFDGPMDALTPQEVVFEAQQLPSGVYFVRATGEHFTAVRRVTLVK